MAAHALHAGADLLGGAPWLDEDPAGAYETLVDIAAAAGVGLDLHVDETLDPETFTLPHLIDRVEDGFPHPVTVDHVVSLGTQSADVQRHTAQRLAAARVAVAVLPATNLYLQGRGPITPAARGITALRTLIDAGVTVAAGADNIRDPFNPTGRLDPLETAALLITAGHLDPSEALSAVSGDARSLMGLPAAPREDKNEVRIRASSANDAIAGASADRVVFRGGEVLARTTVESVLAL